MQESVLYTIDSLYREPMQIKGYCFGNVSEKTLCIMGALRGNEVTQMYVCAKLVKVLKKLEESGQIAQDVGIMVVPCANYYSMNIDKRFWPMDNSDINRMFPGYSLGETTQRIAEGIFRNVQGYEYAVQLASFYQSGKFLTHVKHMMTSFTNKDGLSDFGLPYAVERDPRPYDTTTLNYNWQLWDTKAYSLFTQSTDDLDDNAAIQAVDAILRFMNKRKIIRYKINPGFVTTIVRENEMIQLHCPCGGLCRTKADVGELVQKGEIIAEILDPFTCETKAQVKAAEDSVIFYETASPLAVEGTVIFKLIKNETH
ncbi:MAG: M14 family metallopeptidase [Ruminococcus sp.]|nr:M14 family metallopeptidase [Ruminococcus sp.]